MIEKCKLCGLESELTDQINYALEQVKYCQNCVNMVERYGMPRSTINVEGDSYLRSIGFKL